VLSYLDQTIQIVADMGSQGAEHLNRENQEMEIPKEYEELV